MADIPWSWFGSGEENIGNEIQEYVQKRWDISAKWGRAFSPDDAEGVVDIVSWMCEHHWGVYLFISRASLLFSHGNMCKIIRLLSAENSRKKTVKRNRVGFTCLEVQFPMAAHSRCVCPLPSLHNKPLVLLALWRKLPAIGFFNRRESHVCPRDLLFSEPHLWRNGFTGVPSAEEWRSAPTLEMPFAARCNC